MKLSKLILPISLLSVAILAGCTEDNNDLQGKLKKEGGPGTSTVTRSAVGINQEDISGFRNSDQDNPTQVTVTFSNTTVALNNGCELEFADSSQSGSITTKTTSSAPDESGAPFNSFLAGLQCGDAEILENPYTVDVKISFSAGGTNYSATTTLSAEGGA
ncbi:hypothetical protein LO80_06795 [Candidatus Francisella endociliophora]|uniref:Lipoprotein n=1 Tax=Candidatus Francisella endociliophora TaxID=653937 RepID=A0A097EQ50_9GAMM|nr:hypothetical protein [Francisella sp. FSC1006]AIT09698.1 hypothetical protein LO80_06795 [Francisella sp. FSC1006]